MPRDLLKKLLATLAFCGPLAFAVHEMSRHGGHPILHALSVGIVVAMAATWIRSIHAQLAARGAALLLAGFFSYGVFATEGRDGYVLAAAAGGFVALFSLGGPGAEARSFQPIAYRATFLAGCVAMFASAALLVPFAYEGLTHWHKRGGLVSLTVLALLVASSIGVARMRAWGVFTALLASGLAGLGAVLLQSQARELLGFRSGAYEARPWTVAWSIAAVVALVVVSPIALSRVRARPAQPTEG